MSVPVPHMSLHTVDPSAWFPHPSALPMHQTFVPIDEFGSPDFIGVLLMVLCVFAVLLVPFRSLCMPVCVVDASTTFPKLSVLFQHQDPAPIGKLDGFCSFGDMLMTSGIFAAIFALIRLLCTCVHLLDASGQFPGFFGFSGCDFRGLAGKFDLLQPF